MSRGFHLRGASLQFVGRLQTEAFQGDGSPALVVQISPGGGLSGHEIDVSFFEFLGRCQRFGRGAIRRGLPCLDLAPSIFQFGAQGREFRLLTGDQRRLYF